MEWDPNAWLAQPVSPAGEAAEAAVVAKAGELVRAAMGADPDWAPPPFPPERLANALGVEVLRTPELGGWDALLVPHPKSPKILVNTRANPGRIAFSVAHEVAHLFFTGCSEERYHLRTRRPEDYGGSPEVLQLERMCDLGAAEMLLPQPWFGEAVATEGLRAGAVPVLAERFAVSLEATAVRLAQTAKRPVAVGFFDFAAQPSAYREAGSRESRRVAYRVRRVFRSRGFPFLFPPGKSVAESSAVFRASLGREEASAVEEFALGPTRSRLAVTAFPLRRPADEGPPPVCAVFRPV